MTARRSRADKRPTWTSLVEKTLRDTDDFVDTPRLIVKTKGSYNQVSAALSWLKRARVVEALEAEGRLWWFLTGEDPRSRTVEERTPEPKGNRTRRRAGPLIQPPFKDLP